MLRDLPGTIADGGRDKARHRRQAPQQLLVRRGAFEAFGIFLGDEAGGQIARTKALVLHDRAEEIDIVAKPLDLERIEREDLQIGGLVARLAPGHQLGDHGIVEHRYLAAFEHPVIDPHAVHAPAPIGLAVIGPARQRGIVAHQPPGRRQEAAIGVFGIDAAFDRPAVDSDIVLRHLELFARSDPDHLFDQIDPGDRFGHRMFDLQAGVHFEKIEALARLVGTRDDQFDRARAMIIDGPRQRDRLLAHRLAHPGRDEG